MSLVGPRPEDSGFVALHEEEYQEILSVRPGITGLGQLAFAKEAEILDPGDRVGHYVDRILPQKVHLDLLYARSRTIRGDLRILVWTVLPVILRVNVAVNRARASSRCAGAPRRRLRLNPGPLMADNKGMPDLDAALEAELLRLTHHTPERILAARHARRHPRRRSRPSAGAVHIGAAEAADADREPLDPRDPRHAARRRRLQRPHLLRRLPLAPDPRRVRQRPGVARLDHVGEGGRAARHRRPAASRRRARLDLPRHERRPADDARHRCAARASPRERQRPHDRDAPSARAERLRRAPPR